MVSVIWLEDAMREAGYTTYKSLAEDAGVSPQTISRAVKEGEVRESTAEKIQSALGPDYKIGPMSSFLGDHYGVQTEIERAERAGFEYEVRQSAYVAKVCIKHPLEDGYITVSTFSLDELNWQTKAVEKANELNEELD